MITNLAQYHKQAYTRKASFIYRGTTALKRGFGMCFDMDYYTDTTGEAVTDAFGARAMKEVQVPSASNANRFAGVILNDLGVAEVSPGAASDHADYEHDCYC